MENQAAREDQLSRKAHQDAVLAILPDICHQYLEKVGAERDWDHQATLTYILDQAEIGSPYPKQPRIQKRKREEEDSDGDDLGRRFSEVAIRKQAEDPSYFTTFIKTSKTLLRRAFPLAYSLDVHRVLKENGRSLSAAYRTLDQEFSPGVDKPRFKRKKLVSNIPDDDAPWDHSAAKDAFEEFRVIERKRNIEKQQEELEARNLEKAKADGAMGECQCCFNDVPLNRMVHCDAGEKEHYFCYSCSRQLAETQIGMSKHQLACMSADGCGASFSVDQRKLFLDEKLLMALGRIEMQQSLRAAEIERLETCPFCSYAAEYPSVEENKEFKCENPECGALSCRLCRQETHVPITCEEAAAPVDGEAIRHQIEEAMSSAMIRKCNQCGTPFIKESGCNKMQCTGCGNLQCYVCSKTCGYQHFDDTTRGGKHGQCPLFDKSGIEKRHADEVREAEQQARKRVHANNPTFDGSLLTVGAPDKVTEIDERRRLEFPTRQLHQVQAGMPS
ncbi:hypothetical protein GQ53DRAFT_634215 [Thozetella sp. PMI_491]|nr:hypothetical protein GQ53DRAFT_634215 [Thozetella sp. PMI_491]